MHNVDVKQYYKNTEAVQKAKMDPGGGAGGSAQTQQVWLIKTQHYTIPPPPFVLNVQSPNTELKFLIKINIDLIIFQDFRLTWVNYSQKLTESFHKFLTSEILCNVTLWVHKSSEVGQPKTTSHEASSCNSIKAHQVSKIEVLKIKFY